MSSQSLEIVTTANQDPLLSHVPIIGVDIWEHAFYLQYLNVKADVRSLMPPVDNYSPNILFSTSMPSGTSSILMKPSSAW